MEISNEGVRRTLFRRDEKKSSPPFPPAATAVLLSTADSLEDFAVEAEDDEEVLGLMNEVDPGLDVPKTGRRVFCSR